jgi:hypothetical protein
VTLIDDLLTSHPDGQQLGEALRAYWAVTHARQPDQTPLTLLTNPTFTQLPCIDAYQREAENKSQLRVVSPEFVTVRFRLNECLVPLGLNVADLREPLGLPDYSLRPPYRPPFPAATLPSMLKIPTI